MMWMYVMKSRQERENWHKLALFDTTEYKSKGRYKYWDKKNNVIRVGDTVYIYLPVPFNFIQKKAINMQHLMSDLRFEITFNNSWVLSGSVANLSLTDVSAFIRSHREEE